MHMGLEPGEMVPPIPMLNDYFPMKIASLGVARILPQEMVSPRNGDEVKHGPANFGLPVINMVCWKIPQLVGPMIFSFRISQLDQLAISDCQRETDFPKNWFPKFPGFGLV